MSAAEVPLENGEVNGGASPRHIDYETAQLDRLARGWIDVQQTRIALAQRELDVPGFAKGEAQLSRLLSKTLREHSLWPWLSQFPGLGGVHTALIIGRIGDPRRYPGQRCSEGHYLPPLYAVGAACPIADLHFENENRDGGGASLSRTDESRHESNGNVVCPGFMLQPRTTTGVRSLWHWAGLHVVDGRSPKKRKGVQFDWEPRVRASVLQPGGIAEQIVRLRVPVYRDLYDATKERLTRERGFPAEVVVESELHAGGPAVTESAEAPAENEQSNGALRPIQIEGIARKVAAKAFLGDLLTEWKRLAA